MLDEKTCFVLVFLYVLTSIVFFHYDESGRCNYYYLCRVYLFRSLIVVICARVVLFHFFSVAPTRNNRIISRNPNGREYETLLLFALRTPLIRTEINRFRKNAVRRSRFYIKLRSHSISRWLGVNVEIRNINPNYASYRSLIRVL